MTSFERLARPVLRTLGGLALCSLSACATSTTLEPLADYGLGHYRSVADWQSSTAVATAAPLMDYGIALFDAPQLAVAGGSLPTRAAR